jgi:hypothetical protein
MVHFRLVISALTIFLQFHGHVKKAYGMGRAVRESAIGIDELTPDYK